MKRTDRFILFALICAILCAAVSCAVPAEAGDLGEFALLTPVTNAEHVSLMPIFSWEEAENATSYTVKIAKNTALTEGAKEYTSATNSLTMTESLDVDTTYYWTVLAGNGANKKYASAIWLFKTVNTTETKTGAFTLTAPEDGGTNVELQPLFVWEASSSATRYTLEVGKTEDFSSAVQKKENIFTPYFSFLTNSMFLDAAVDYFWRVTALADGLEGTQSTVFTFRTEDPRPWAEFTSDLLTGWRKADSYSGTIDDLVLSYEPWCDLGNGNSLYVAGTIEQSTYVQVSYGFPSDGRTLASAGGIEFWVYPKKFHEKLAFSVTLCNEFPNVYYQAVTLNDLSGPTLVRIPFAALTKRAEASQPIFDRTDWRSIWINIGDAGQADLGGKTGGERLGAGESADFALCFDNITGYYDESITAMQQTPLAPGYNAAAVTPIRLFAPEDNDERAAVKPSLRWEASAYAASYRLEISETSDFAVPMVDEAVDTFKYTLAAALAFETQYYWRVTASAGELDDYTSEVYSFTTLDEESSQPEKLPDKVVNMTTLFTDNQKYVLGGGANYVLTPETSTEEWVEDVTLGATLKIEGGHAGNWAQINYWGMGAFSASGYTAVSFYLYPETCDAYSSFSLDLGGARYRYRITGDKLQAGVPVLVTIPLSVFILHQGTDNLTDFTDSITSIYITFEGSVATAFTLYFSDLTFIDDTTITAASFVALGEPDEPEVPEPLPDKVVNMTTLQNADEVDKYDIGGGDTSPDIAVSLSTDEWAEDVTLGATLKLEGTRTQWLQYKYFGFGSADLTGYTAVSFYLLPEAYMNEAAGFRIELVRSGARYRYAIPTARFDGHKPLLVTIPLSLFLSMSNVPLTDDASAADMANIINVYISFDQLGGTYTEFTYLFSDLTFVDDATITAASFVALD
jgi:hypothetical protein